MFKFMLSDAAEILFYDTESHLLFSLGYILTKKIRYEESTQLIIKNVPSALSQLNLEILIDENQTIQFINKALQNGQLFPRVCQFQFQDVFLHCEDDMKIFKNGEYHNITINDIIENKNISNSAQMTGTILNILNTLVGNFLGPASRKNVDTSISAESTSANLPTSAAVAAFVEGKGYITTDTDTKNTAGATDTSNKIYLIGATEQTENPQTYTDNEIFARNGILYAKTLTVGNRMTGSSIGTNSSAEGKNLVVSGDYSHSEGISGVALGDAAHTEGGRASAQTRTRNIISISEDRTVVTIAAEGAVEESFLGSLIYQDSTNAMIINEEPEILQDQTKNWQKRILTFDKPIPSSITSYFSLYKLGNAAKGAGSHAEGWGTSAFGDYSHAEGIKTTARAESSHTEGLYTEAWGNAQHVEGKFNIPDETSLHILGNGSYNAPSNAHTIASNGDAWFVGDIYTGSTSGTNKDSGSKKVATEEYVDTHTPNDSFGTYTSPADDCLCAAYSDWNKTTDIITIPTTDHNLAIINEWFGINDGNGTFIPPKTSNGMPSRIKILLESDREGGEDYCINFIPMGTFPYGFSGYAGRVESEPWGEETEVGTIPHLASFEYDRSQHLSLL